MTSLAAQTFADAWELLKEQLGVEVTHRIGGSLINTETVTAIVDCSDAQAERNKGGPGVATDAKGKRDNQDVWLEMDISVAAVEKSEFVLPDGVVAKYVTPIGKDEVCQTLLCRVPRGITTKSARIRQ